MPRVRGKSYPECWIHEPRVCPTCGDTFRRPREQTYCSQGCRRFGWGDCFGCGEPFEKKSSNARYCDPACRDQTKADRAALYWRRSRRPQIVAARAEEIRVCELPACGKQIEDPYGAQKFHPRCYRQIHNLMVRNRRRSTRFMKKLTDKEYEDLSVRALLGEEISDEDWLACHEKAKEDPGQGPMGELLERIAKDVVQTLYGVIWSEADQHQQVMALKRAQLLFSEGIEKHGKETGLL